MGSFVFLGIDLFETQSYQDRSMEERFSTCCFTSQIAATVREGPGEAKSFIRVCYVGAGTQALGSSSAAFLGTSEGGWRETGTAGTKN